MKQKKKRVTSETYSHKGTLIEFDSPTNKISNAKYNYSKRSG